MITPCKMRLPEKDREELYTRIVAACEANGVKRYENGGFENKPHWAIDRDDFYYLGDWDDEFYPEIEPLAFLKKYEKGDAAKFFRQGVADGGAGSPGDCIITVDGKIDATEILEQLVAEPDDLNLPMKTKDARNLFEREQAYADSQVKEVPRETIKRIIYIDERPMSHRMGWEAE